MTDILMEVPLASGQTVIVEVDRQEVPSDLVLASNDPSAVAVKATETFEHVLDKVKPALQAVSTWAKSASPDECCVEFGLKLGVETGVIIAKGTANVHFVVKLTWKSRHEPVSGA
ncbi:MAG: CU044_2847 family protein [Pseudonocardiaceae bacterium]